MNTYTGSLPQAGKISEKQSKDTFFLLNSKEKGGKVSVVREKQSGKRLFRTTIIRKCQPYQENVNHFRKRQKTVNQNQEKKRHLYCDAM
ncbi:MAG: hypothetical protein J6T94_00530 [Bacteroidaceae bacterium]|nr:hypothetical protein [Bacteroidaceae bacterium]